MVGAAEMGGGCADLAHASHSLYASYSYGMVGVRGMRRVEKGLWGVLRVMRVLSRVWAVGLGFGFFVFSRDLFCFGFHGSFGCCLGRCGCRIRSGHHNGRCNLQLRGYPNEGGENTDDIN